MIEQGNIPDIGDRPDISWSRRMEMGSFEPHPIEIPVTTQDQENTQVEVRHNNQADRTTVVDFAVKSAIAHQAME